MKVLSKLNSLDNVNDGDTRKLITKTSGSGTGNVVSSISVSGDTISYTKGVNALTNHQNTFSTVKVGNTNVAADKAGDTLELAAGSNITLTPDATNNKVTIAATVPTKTSELTNDSGFITSDSDEKVKQIANTSSNSALRVLFAPNVLDTDYTGNVNKNSNFTYNPSTKALATGGTVDGYKLAAASAKGVDTNITATSTSSNLPTSQAVANLVKGMKGANNGLAELDANGKVPSSQLPSYVDDVLEYTSQSAFPATGETGKIYIAQDTNKTYRWSGTAYTEISASLALGETSSTAYRGDRGKIAYDHSQSTHARTDATATAASATNGNIKINGTETTVYTHPNSGVSAGTYKSVTVDTNGHVTAGSNPTTLSGYGITDASINNSNRTVTLGNNSIIIPNSTSRFHDGSDSWGGVYQQRASQYTGADALATGYGTSATGSYAFTSGWNTLASGTGAHAEGQATIAKGTSSHAEGLNTYAGETNSHAEGRPLENLNNAYEIIGTANVTAIEAIASSRLKKYTLDDNSFLKSSIIGKMACLYTSSGSLLSRRIILAYDTTNSTITISCEDSSATAIASITIVDIGGRATGTASHSEGEGTIAAGSYSHSEGYRTWAQDLYSHTEGIGTVARGEAQHVQGKWNTVNVNYADIVGNGTAEDARSNAYTLDWKGNGVYAGKVTVGTGPVNDMDVATKQYVDAHPDTKNTAGSTDTSSKIFLIGATSQAANPQTYSDNEVFATNGVLQAKEYSINNGAKIVYNSTDKTIEFKFI